MKHVVLMSIPQTITGKNIIYIYIHVCCNHIHFSTRTKPPPPRLHLKDSKNRQCRLRIAPPFGLTKPLHHKAFVLCCKWYSSNIDIPWVFSPMPSTPLPSSPQAPAAPVESEESEALRRQLVRPGSPEGLERG